MFRADRTQNVIVRLRHNVIRTGLRRINLAYSRIGLADVAAKLGLPDAGDVECIVAKAIRSAEGDFPQTLFQAAAQGYTGCAHADVHRRNRNQGCARTCLR